MKTFRLFENKADTRLRWWDSVYTFYCRNGECNNCKRKFLCYTNGNIVNIVDDKLINKLKRIGGRHSWDYKRDVVRKMFFE
jgi:hypothetical protein